VHAGGGAFQGREDGTVIAHNGGKEAAHKDRERSHLMQHYIPLQRRESLRCCAEILSSLFTMTVPGFVLSLIAAAVGLLLLMDGDAVSALALVGLSR
jgi:hypothetical protein